MESIKVTKFIYFGVIVVVIADVSPQVTVYQCLEGGVIAVLQSYVDEDVCEDICPLMKTYIFFFYRCV